MFPALRASASTTIQGLYSVKLPVMESHVTLQQAKEHIFHRGVVRMGT